MIRIPLLASASLVALTTFSVLPAYASDAILALERKELSQSCAEIQFLDDFVTEVNANDDALPDYLVNMQHLRCDGSMMMWCGTMGCVHHIWMQKPGGGFDLAYDYYAYEIVFDRPGDTSFKVTTRDGVSRENLVETANSGKTAPDTGTMDAPADRWVYLDDLAPMAVIGSPDARLSLTCESGALRLRYSAWWLFKDEEVDPLVREWLDSPDGVIPAFAVGNLEVPVPVRVSDQERMLVSQDRLPLDAPLVDAMARGAYVTVYRGGSLEHELQYPLAGSSKAIAQLKADCD